MAMSSLTADKIAALEGAELDAAVAEAMGLDFWVGEGGEVMIRRNRRTEMWYPHSDANAALEFAKFVSKKVGRPMGASLYAEHASAWFGPLMFADCLDLAEAICRAGLLALLVARKEADRE